jgi:hypothetical protein
VGVGTTALGWILCSMLLIGALSWAAISRPWQKPEAVPGPAPSPSPRTEILEAE